MKKIITLTVVLTLGASGLVWAEEMNTAGAAAEVAGAATEMAADAATTVESTAVETAAVETAAAEVKAEEVNNTICPLSGRELKLGEEEIAKLEYNGKIYNVCPVAKAEYDKDPSAFAEKLAKFAADSMEKAQAGMADMKGMAGEMKDMTGEMKDMAGAASEETKPMAQ